jgi:hypothetical protein
VLVSPLDHTPEKLIKRKNMCSFNYSASNFAKILGFHQNKNKYLNEAVLESVSASALVRSYVSIDPHVDDVVVRVHDCIPHLVYASFVPFTHRSF